MGAKTENFEIFMSLIKTLFIISFIYISYDYIKVKSDYDILNKEYTQLSIYYIEQKKMLNEFLNNQEEIIIIHNFSEK